MMITTPVPAALKPGPLTPTAPAPGAPMGAPTIPGAATAPSAKTPAGPATDGAKQGAPAPGGQAAPVDAAAAQQAVIEKLQKTSAADAIAQVDAHLAKIASLSVGGGTPDGAQGAKLASALLTDASMLLQHADVQAMQQLRNMATELHMRLMSSASGLAFMGGQVALAGGSKAPVKLGEIAAGSIAETKAVMAQVAVALAPPAAIEAQPVSGAADAAVPTPVAANGNGGVVGPIPANPTKIEPTAPGVSII